MWKNSEIEEIFNINSEEQFNELSLKIFRYQYKNIKVYQNYVDLIRKNNSKIEHYTEIPFLPIQFFKKFIIQNQNLSSEIIFKSSGTSSSDRSHHLIVDLQIYKKSSKTQFESFFSSLSDRIVVLGLLPSYLENGESSLIYMVRFFIEESKNEKSGFYLYNFEFLAELLENLEYEKNNVFLFGVSYALLDFSEQFPISLHTTKIIETGGMKGRKKEISKIELLQTLSKNFKTSSIYSEYGMTELLSQAYASIDGIYHTPKWEKVLIRKIDNPFQYESVGKIGGVNVIDLANLYSCSFIETQDLGKSTITGDFELVGRIENSDIRGCALLYC